MSQKLNVMNLSGDFPILRRLREENSAFIPISFYRSLESFCNRNAIIVQYIELGKLKTKREVCMQCLKAFILDEAINRYALSIDLISIAVGIDAPLGHGRYYDDKGQIKKI